MTRDFLLPPIDEGVTSVDLAMLNVAVGDEIEAGTVVAEVETDKAAADVEVDFAGKVVAIHGKPGDSILVGDPLLSIEESNGAASADAAPPKPAAEPDSAPTPPTDAPKAETRAEPARVPAVQPKPVPVEPDIDQPPAPAGPATRRLARQLGVDLHGVPGSAAGGRITQEDVKTHVRQIMEGGASAGSGGGYAPPPLPDFSQWGETEREPLSRIGRAAANNLSMCWNVIPHVTQHDLVDVTDLESARRRHSDIAKKTGSQKITMTAVAMKASAISLAEFPKFNSSLDPQTNELVYRKYFHIGCAVDTPGGLLVPVVRDCDQKSVLQIATELSDLAARGREGDLKLSEMQGACFTITNLGGIGGTSFTPIVNYPEVAILGMSRGRNELRAHEGEIEERLMLPLSLSYDHRVINGADAARFVVRIGQLLGDAFLLAALA